MVAIITGGSKGLGLAMAKKFIHEGYHLALCARNEADLLAAKTVLQNLNPDACILTYACDLSIKKEVEDFANKVLETYETLDVLVNNAGSFQPGELCEEADGLLKNLMATNLYSAYYLTRMIAPRMKQQRHGLIVNISSVAGLQAYTHGGSYSISKFALSGFSKNLRQELMPYGIKVSTIYPGATLSDSWKGSQIDPARIMEAEDVSNMIFAMTTLSPQAVVEEVVMRPMLGDL
ncbi:MAG: SDR family oxidoreductase [Chitinophagaceae bacterium]|nr:SDR family oxidoreductase [Chitinophagaceae bacterium]